MDMRIDEARYHEPTGCVDRLFGFGTVAGPHNSHDPAVVDQNTGWHPACGSNENTVRDGQRRHRKACITPYLPTAASTCKAIFDQRELGAKASIAASSLPKGTRIGRFTPAAM